MSFRGRMIANLLSTRLFLLFAPRLVVLPTTRKGKRFAFATQGHGGGQAQPVSNRCRKPDEQSPALSAPSTHINIPHSNEKRYVLACGPSHSEKHARHTIEGIASHVFPEAVTLSFIFCCPVCEYRALSFSLFLAMGAHREVAVVSKQNTPIKDI